MPAGPKNPLLAGIVSSSRLWQRLDGWRIVISIENEYDELRRLSPLAPLSNVETVSH